MDARDFDDAISLARTPEGGYWLGVHIADVSHFVPAGSPLDRGAAERAFSLYVPGRVAPMLPPELSNDLCSLRPREDRFCVTVELPFDVNLELGEPAFYRSVIRSRARLTYGQAERILHGDESAEPEIAEGLGLAETVALEPRRRRFAAGSPSPPRLVPSVPGSTKAMLVIPRIGRLLCTLGSASDARGRRPPVSRRWLLGMFDVNVDGRPTYCMLRGW